MGEDCDVEVGQTCMERALADLQEQSQLPHSQRSSVLQLDSKAFFAIAVSGCDGEEKQISNVHPEQMLSELIDRIGEEFGIRSAALQLCFGSELLSYDDMSESISSLGITQTSQLSFVRRAFVPGFYCTQADYEPVGRTNTGGAPVWEFRANGSFTFSNGCIHEGRKEGEWWEESGVLKLRGKTFDMASMQPWAESGTFSLDISVRDFIAEHGNLMEDSWKPPKFRSYLD